GGAWNGNRSSSIPPQAANASAEASGSWGAQATKPPLAGGAWTGEGPSVALAETPDTAVSTSATVPAASSGGGWAAAVGGSAPTSSPGPA
ncbi:unnamed protein product, partial [Scytosiphon promiscuus]